MAARRSSTRREARCSGPARRIRRSSMTASPAPCRTSCAASAPRRRPRRSAVRARPPRLAVRGGLADRQPGGRAHAGAGRLPGDAAAVVGGEPTFALLELATGARVPDRDLHRPAVRALTEMAILVAALDNDAHSLHKELTGGQADQNVYTVLMQELECPLQDAYGRHRPARPCPAALHRTARPGPADRRTGPGHLSPGAPVRHPRQQRVGTAGAALSQLRSVAGRDGRHTADLGGRALRHASRAGGGRAGHRLVWDADLG